jgi:hypothetical protein
MITGLCRVRFDYVFCFKFETRSDARRFVPDRQDRPPNQALFLHRGLNWSDCGPTSGLGSSGRICDQVEKERRHKEADRESDGWDAAGNSLI